jgi:hypothetical protein
LRASSKRRTEATLTGLYVLRSRFETEIVFAILADAT